MKNYALISITALSLLTANFITPAAPINRIAPSTQVVLQDLLQYFRTDNLSALKDMIKKNPQFKWNKTYLNFPWPSESQTALSAATIHHAYKCLNFLLLKNPGNVRSSINTSSSHGYTPLHYATTGNYANPKIATLLQKYGAQS
jgi:hypothetical protein